MFCNHKQVNCIQKPRYGHSLTAFVLSPKLTYVTEFGGSSDLWAGSDDKQPKIADTTLLQFGECLSILVCNCLTFAYI